MKDELTIALEKMLRTRYGRISEMMTQFSRREQMWYELLLRHESIEVDPSTERPVDRDKYCYLESPAWDGNVVRMPREMALKILALGFMYEPETKPDPK